MSLLNPIAALTLSGVITATTLTTASELMDRADQQMLTQALGQYQRFTLIDQSLADYHNRPAHRPEQLMKLQGYSLVLASKNITTGWEQNQQVWLQSPLKRHCALLSDAINTAEISGQKCQRN